ncbi:MAG: RluA family pseudouridine synthase [Chloroflexota bacterium]
MSNQNVEFNIALQGNDVGQRLDKVVTDHLAIQRVVLSRVKVQQLIKEGHIAVDGKPGKASYRLEGGEAIAVFVADSVLASDWAATTPAEAMPLDVIYEDETMAAINKPAGMVVHPAVGHTSGTLVNAILGRWPQIAQVGGEGRAGIVHRLDKDTSGVILIAKTEPARLNLMTQFESRNVQKRYLALVEGTPKTPTGEIDAPIGRDPHERKRMAVVRRGREAVTNYRVLEHYALGDARYTLVEALPKTGRTHQIRVHLAFIGHPIVGDSVYGRRKVRIGLKRHFLHAESITLTIPSTGKTLTLHAPLPPELQTVLDKLEAYKPQ